MEETIKERLTAYLRYKGINKSEFGRIIGVSNAYISSMRKSIQPDKAEKIASEKRYQRHECALISKAEEQDILNSAHYSYVEEQGFYIVKGMNGKTMRNMLILLSQRLNLQLEVNYE